MSLTPEFLLQILIALSAAGGVYAGIRVDLARLHERTDSAQKAADKAHERIDSFQQFTTNQGRRSHD